MRSCESIRFMDSLGSKMLNNQPVRWVSGEDRRRQQFTGPSCFGNDHSDVLGSEVLLQAPERFCRGCKNVLEPGEIFQRLSEFSRGWRIFPKTGKFFQSS